MNGLETLYWLSIAAVCVALAAAFVVLLMKKWGIAEWYQVHGGDFMSKLFSCDFCMSFWSAVVICAALAAVFNAPMMYFVPILSTPITRMIV